MQTRHVDRALYFKELAVTSEKYLLPFIEEIYPIHAGMKVLEIGCGEGGNLIPFMERGCQVTGVDLDPTRIQQASQFIAERGYTARLIVCDILSENRLNTDYDLILVHDVIEHIQDKEALFKIFSRLLSPKGVIYIGFPAWQMPFGGHQQICPNKIASHLPFIHLLPRRGYRLLLRGLGVSLATIDALCEIKDCGISIEKFCKLTKKFHCKILKSQLYFINPHYETKFGLKPRKLYAGIASIPWVRNFFTTSCFFLLSPVTE